MSRTEKSYFMEKQWNLEPFILWCSCYGAIQGDAHKAWTKTFPFIGSVIKEDTRPICIMCLVTSAYRTGANSEHSVEIRFGITFGLTTVPIYYHFPNSVTLRFSEHAKIFTRQFLNRYRLDLQNQWNLHINRKPTNTLTNRIQRAFDEYFLQILQNTWTVI